MENNEILENGELVEEITETVSVPETEVEGLETVEVMEEEGVLQNEISALTPSDADYSVQPLADQYGNYAPWEYYQVIHDACSVAIQEQMEDDMLLVNESLTNIGLYSLGILSTLVLGGVVWFVKSLLSPKS